MAFYQKELCSPKPKRSLVPVSDQSSPRFNPVLLIVVGVLVLAALAFGVMALKNSSKDDASVEAVDKGPGRKSARGSSTEHSYTADNKHGKKSEDAREGSRPNLSAGARSLGAIGDVEKLFVEVSIAAREELKLIRERSATEYDDPEERRAFGVKLSQISDPQERQRVLRERTELMRAARARVDAAKTVEDRDREKQLIVLMQVQNLWRMAEFVGKNPNLQEEAADFEESLADWVQSAEQVDNDTFHSSFNTLRDSLNELRRRNAQSGQPEALRANLPSERLQDNPAPQP
jgi:hypothetical protein